MGTATAVAAGRTLADAHVELLGAAGKLLEQSPVGGSICLMVRPSGFEAAPGMVYVQRPPRADGVVELHPVPVSELNPDDLIHDTQILDPTDSAFLIYAGSDRAGQRKCGIDHLSGIHQHD